MDSRPPRTCPQADPTARRCGGSWSGCAPICALVSTPFVPDDDLFVIGRENRAFYNRILLPDYINAERCWEELQTLGASGMRELGVDFLPGVLVTRVDRDQKLVFWEGGSAPYDKLILCTGSRAFVPPGVPVGLPGVHTLRTRDDADMILSRLTKNSHVLVIGGGLLGIEMAAALNHVGIVCTVIEMGPRLMLRQLDAIGSELLEEELVERGIPVLCGDQVVKFEGLESVTGVQTKDGLSIACDLVVVAVGTRPNVEVFESTELKGERGLAVDAHLLTADPDIYALGEIAEFKGQCYGITHAAQQQAEVAAAHCAGDAWAAYSGSVLFNILKIHGRSVASAGLAEAPPDDPEYEEVSFLDRRRRLYKKCVIHRDRLVGCVFVGDTTQFPAYRDLIERGLELDELRDTLLREGVEAPEAPIGRIVCSCNQVGEGNLLAAIRSGITDLPTLCTTTRAGTGCGSCRPELQLLVQREQKCATAE